MKKGTKKAGARRECPNCGGRMRKGTSTRAMMFDAYGAASWGIVCAKCIATAVSVVVPKAVTVTPATQVHTCQRLPGRRPGAIVVRTGRGSGRGQPVDDRHTFLIHLHPRDERPDELLPLVPRQSVEAVLYAGGELLETTGNGLEGDGLGQLFLGLA
jgi:hypothetical protein